MTGRRLERKRQRHSRGPNQLAVLLLGVAVLILLSSCPQPILTARLAADYYGRNVTYDDNGSTGGDIPTDTNFYRDGATVTALGNTGGLERTGYPFFIGWSTEPDATGTIYRPGEESPCPGPISRCMYCG